MNTRIADIFKRVRDTLNDPNGDRWDNDALFRLVQDCLTDLSIHTNAFNDETLVPIQYGEAIYPLPENNYHLKGILYAGADLPIYSVSQMRAIYGVKWRTHSSDKRIVCAVKENLDNTKFQIYPRPMFDFLCLNELEESEEEFGITTKGSCEEFGFIQSVHKPNTLVYVDEFGVKGSKDDKDTLVVIYTKKLTIETLEDQLLLPPIYDMAIKYYVTAKALRNDMSESNRAVGAEEFQLYARELEKLATLTQTNNTPSNQHRTIYQGMG